MLLVLKLGFTWAIINLLRMKYDDSTAFAERNIEILKFSPQLLTA